MFAKDIGIDLGTANVLIYIKGQGIVLNEPSVVAVEEDGKKVLAVGEEAYKMLGRTPGKVHAIRPMKDGVIADFETTEIMLNHFIRKVNGKSFFSRPRILICCPSNITQVEKNAIKEANGLHIPVFAITDTNVDPTNIDYVIPANDDSLKATTLILNYFVEAIKEGKK